MSQSQWLCVCEIFQNQNIPTHFDNINNTKKMFLFYFFADFNGDGKPDNITFMIKRIKVHNKNALKDPTYRFPGNYGVEKFLELFSGKCPIQYSLYLFIFFKNVYDKKYYDVNVWWITRTIQTIFVFFATIWYQFCCNWQIFSSFSKHFEYIFS